MSDINNRNMSDVMMTSKTETAAYLTPRRTANQESQSFMVILKVHSNDINLRDNKHSISKLHSYRIYCHHLENHESSEHTNSNIWSPAKVQVFVLEDSTKITESMPVSNGFHNQKPMGEPIGSNDFTIFKSPVYEGTGRKVSFAIDLAMSNHTTSLEDLSEEDCRKLGTAYMYLDPNFSTQGTQRMQIIGAQTFAPIGNLSVEYLIVKYPYAAEISSPKPKWLISSLNLDQGHRGAGSGCRPDLGADIVENTVASFNYAARHGADMVELDVICTLDGVPVVYHDFSVEVEGLGKTQIGHLKLDDIRNLKLASIHDKSCGHSNNRNPNCPSKSCSRKEYNLVLPTLEEVLKGVDHNCALNIELKVPQILANGSMESQPTREYNDNVDRILDCIDEFENGRRIVLSTFNPNVAILLRLKQCRYPVFFLTTGDSMRFSDPSTKSVKNAIHFAKVFDLAGVNPNVDYLNEKHVRYAHERGLLVYAWGNIQTEQAIKELRHYGLNGIIYDKIDLIKPTS